MNELIALKLYLQQLINYSKEFGVGHDLKTRLFPMLLEVHPIRLKEQKQVGSQQEVSLPYFSQTS